jgi:hypothetical protein
MCDFQWHLQFHIEIKKTQEQISVIVFETSVDFLYNLIRYFES